LDKRGAHCERFDHEIKSVGSEHEALQKGYFGAKDGHFHSLYNRIGAQINGECKVMAAHFRASFYLDVVSRPDQNMAAIVKLNYKALSARVLSSPASVDVSTATVQCVQDLKSVVEGWPVDRSTARPWLSKVWVTVDGAVERNPDWSVLLFVLTLLAEATQQCDLTTADADKLASYVSVLLNHPEVRVRLQTADLVKALIIKISAVSDAAEATSGLVDRLTNYLVQSIAGTWQRKETTRETVLGSEDHVQMDDTTGWGNLETYIKALQAVVLGKAQQCGTSAAVNFMQARDAPAVSGTGTDSSDTTTGDSRQLLERQGDAVQRRCVADLLITDATQHINRHIREGAFKFIAELLSTRSSITNHPTLHNQAYSALHNSADAAASEQWYEGTGSETADRIHAALLSGLQDDWSQIRLAAALACQSFLASLSAVTNSSGTSHSRSQELLGRYWPGILPRLCMNRFYPAASVQTISQDTWRSVLGPNALGRTLLAQHADHVVDYYCAMTAARNHMTSEAACQAIAEFAGRVERAAVLPHVAALLETLCVCLKDDRWPVRDAAIVASGVVTRYFTGERCTQQLLPSLLQHWTDNLTDFIWSVREHAAIAFGEALRGGSETWADEVQKSTVLAAARAYIRSNLYFAHPELSGAVHVDSSAGDAGANIKRPGAKAWNFLPESLLQADAAAKKKGHTTNTEGGPSSSVPNHADAVPSIA
jgi:hypothetical protein